jgi:pyridoxal phosphate enzyme (YggS family)
LDRIEEQIQTACDNSGRKRDSIELIAVTKGFPIDVFRVVSEVGLTEVGENRVQEAVSRKNEIGTLSDSMNWHMVGHVQSNKVKYLLGEFDYLHSMDRESLLEELQKRLSRNDQTQSVLMQVNTSGESSKYGVDPESAPELFEMIHSASQVEVEGLMTMAPYTDDTTVIRETFSNCRKLRDELEETYDVELPELSMGMTNDYPQAIKEGSTMLRIGRGLFGERPN